jgi:hypothetical protein
LQPNRIHLALMLDSRGVDTIETEIVVVIATAGETNRLLIGASTIDGAWYQPQQGGPVPAVNGQICYLLIEDDAAYVRGALS